MGEIEIEREREGEKEKEREREREIGENGRVDERKELNDEYRVG